MSIVLLEPVRVPAVLAELEGLEAQIEAGLLALDPGSGSTDTRNEILLAVHEIAVNMIRHAYRRSDTLGWIEAAIYSDPAKKRVTVVLRDAGTSFDPLAVPIPTFEEPQAGGLGLYIARRLLDEIVYISGPHGNEWRLSRDLGPRPASLPAIRPGDLTLSEEPSEPLVMILVIKR